MLSCQEVTELVTAYVEGQLSRWDRLRFQLHLGTCRHCRRYLRQLRTAQRAVARLPAPPMPEDVKEELLRRFDRWKAR
jgi:anti-sigma factor RsiW